MADIRAELTEVVKRFVQIKYPHVREIRITRMTEGGPINGLNFYKLEGTANVLLGRIPTLVGKSFQITVFATREGRIIDKKGRVL